MPLKKIDAKLADKDGNPLVGPRLPAIAGLPAAAAGSTPTKAEFDAAVDAIIEIAEILEKHGLIWPAS